MRSKSVVLLLIAICSCLSVINQPSFCKTVSSNYMSEETAFNTVSLRVTPSWVSKIPSRGIAKWLDPDRGIYQTPKGYVIGPYASLTSMLRQKPTWLPDKLKGEQYLEAHHLIEKRIASIFGFDPDDLPAVVLSRAEHRGKQGVHNQIYALLPKVRGGSAAAYRGSLAKIQQAYQKVYSSYGRSDWLEPITAVMQEWHSRK